MLRLYFSDDVRPNDIMVTERTVGRTGAHGHDFYELELYLSGEGVTVINGQTHSFTKGTLTLLTPADFHSIYPKVPTTLINLAFSPHLIEQVRTDALLALAAPVCTDMDAQTAERLDSYIRIIASELVGGAPMSLVYVRHLLACIVIEVLRVSKGEEPREHASGPMRRALYYIHTHFKENVSLSDVAAFAGLSSGYLGKRLKEETGVGFKELLTRLRLLHAKQLLLYSDEPVTEISYHCGFGSMTHFLRVFKTEIGISPGAYRRAAKEGSVAASAYPFQEIRREKR